MTLTLDSMGGEWHRDETGTHRLTLKTGKTDWRIGGVVSEEGECMIESENTVARRPNTTREKVKARGLLTGCSKAVDAPAAGAVEHLIQFVAHRGTQALGEDKLL